ncbi:hypothetical protein LPB72_05775 [Hydrogenophaga crassostreae]|uniref:DUF3047 domain-containing protein n=1 Tax=Hydrogenophaga crassostreae TaxID=1763535 RepID=A0A162PB55_9BURK|nr:DUF3047 domain-containing protein [Hydrogenophaga crassostreae]AOW14567.1 hypothetical protein LPB072_18775 [Hydrogenophaga crassostreae]OAD43335.1 hypothetical protein LPB72_05775 [Hydrogenophaga crassostreae]
MKRTTACFCLALLTGISWAQPPAELAPLLDGQGEASKAWRFVGFPKKSADLPPSRFEPGEVDHKPGLKVSTDASYGTWVQAWNGPAPERLQWRWRLDEPLAGGKRAPDLLAKSGDDAALKVCVMFEHPLDSVPFIERTVLRIARSVSGENLPAATVCYIWDSAGPAPRQGVNPYTRRVRFISLQGRNSPLTRWTSESRDVAQDFATLFADELPQGARTPRAELPPVTTVLIGADSDNTASQSVGWVTDLRWVP